MPGPTSAIRERSAKGVLRAAIVLLVLTVLVVALLPPGQRHVDIPPEWRAWQARTVAGAYHIHSTRSDGAGDKAAIAAAAARASLAFVILTDHGDATRPPDPPAYIDGVLCLDAVEISTDQGHYVALDMPRAPYPLGGTAEAVAEDVARLGGFGIAAHPDSPKPSLRWSDDDVRIDGMEWLNADSQWRDESRLALARAAFGYFIRPGQALAELLDRPSALALWDRLSAHRPLVALAAADAHGGVGQQRVEGQRPGIPGARIPSYEASFRTFSNRVVLPRPLTGDAAVDARAIFTAIREGHVFATIDAAASPGLLDFHAEGSTLIARTVAPPGAEIVLFNGGRQIARQGGGVLRWETGDAGGSYRVEVHLPRMPGSPPVPWLVSNEIFRGQPLWPERADEPGAPSGARFPPLPWRIERDPSSGGILRLQPDEVDLDYDLGRAASPFVALATDLAHAEFDAIALVLAADAPMRVSVQVREGEKGRWGRSVYVDSAPREVRVPLAGLLALDGGGAVPGPTSLTSVLLVIDAVNTSPGHRGRLRVLSAGLAGTR